MQKVKKLSEFILFLFSMLCLIFTFFNCSKISLEYIMYLYKNLSFYICYTSLNNIYLKIHLLTDCEQRHNKSIVFKCYYLEKI